MIINGKGITVLYSDQCPIKNITEAAKECSLDIRLHKIDNHIEAQNSPSPYGTFNIIVDGKFLTHRIFDKQRYIGILKSGQV
ncbi:YoaP domain-containing protein [Clostridium sp. YIM B02505]|uniref:YoaP domain-containing protein n=1 Tax=Clostridium yunnanense TaxID=2800325 RepID=A0ABS1EUW2_9CLOT|nr:YoaP domain-containing protein [Clostridium yunnanense]MBK1813118.1 YoaP domain-containing protein [Clostridium yunnanense]